MVFWLRTLFLPTLICIDIGDIEAKEIEVAVCLIRRPTLPTLRIPRPTKGTEEEDLATKLLALVPALGHAITEADLDHQSPEVADVTVPEVTHGNLREEA